MRAGGGERDTWRRLSDGELSWEALRSRARVLEGIRAFFRERGFLEVDPPIAQAYPNIDPNIFPVKITDSSGTATRFYLHTSPEPAMKKLLAAGSGDLFFLGKVFRDREGSPLHFAEFTMLEWYRVDARADTVMRDVEELVRTLARSIAGGTAVRRGNRTVPLDRPWPRWELDDAFRELLGVGMSDEPGLREALTRRGERPGADESWEDLFHRACLDGIEPALADRGACFLTGYPAVLGAMARRRSGRPEVSERFEGFLAGVELVNGYEELTDPAEQEARLLALADRHRRSTGEILPVDPGFLGALRRGLPPCTGAALGVDRLVMLLLGKDDIADGMYR
ncbi:MAG TPA: EF-P lysine aminoacylase GenX [Deltaproteobacteria bacterium]|nr:EF-P lysine aminoacylase GenX [Deltaproteobacteria bacterium]HBG72328.1 EF-P lysine aminoacylase GenX [Deltaproteobacteria bacterium]